MCIAIVHAMELLASLSQLYQMSSAKQYLQLYLFRSKMEFTMEAFLSPLSYICQNCNFLHNSFAHYVAFLQLLQAAESIFTKFLSKSSNLSPEISQLLVVLSDGRGVFADGTLVRQILICSHRRVNCLFVHLFQAVELVMRRLNEMGVFTVFVILDSLLKVTCLFCF